MSDVSENTKHAAVPPEADDAPPRGGFWWILIALVFVGVIAMALFTSKPQAAPEVLLYQIVVQVDRDVPDDYERAKAKIERVRELALRPGRNFSVLSAQEGESMTAKQDNPGEVGWISRGIVPPHVEAVAFRLEINEVSEIIEDEHGFRILTITQKRGTQQ